MINCGCSSYASTIEDIAHPQGEINEAKFVPMNKMMPIKNKNMWNKRLISSSMFQNFFFFPIRIPLLIYEHY
jgi:hypothetical protein